MDDKGYIININGTDYSILDRIGIPEPYRTYIDIMGLDAFRGMIKRYGGKKIYIPKNGFLENMIRDENIKREYNGSNISELSRKYDISRDRIYKIIKNSKKDGTAK